MKKIGLAVVLVSVMACGAGVVVPEETTPEAQPQEAHLPTGILERPFTADEIREEWREGLEIRIRNWSVEDEVFEIWNVVGADEDGCDIQSVTLGADGSPAGEPALHRSGWVELRDHASFPADRATRERASRTTGLGVLDGWLYTVPDPASGRVSEFFFADSLPGAPVFVRVTLDGELVQVFEQVERSRR
ncbi:MAG: hypothetical protein V2I67_11510 [Thermoanaerobaculales bacterium]|jgi:hypothetical protein|nr:hypothetical protein [Thermoanaerobaculales bacterium]